MIAISDNGRSNHCRDAVPECGDVTYYLGCAIGMRAGTTPWYRFLTEVKNCLSSFKDRP